MKLIKYLAVTSILISWYASLITGAFTWMSGGGFTPFKPFYTLDFIEYSTQNDYKQTLYYIIISTLVCTSCSLIIIKLALVKT